MPAKSTASFTRPCCSCLAQPFCPRPFSFFLEQLASKPVRISTSSVLLFHLLFFALAQTVTCLVFLLARQTRFLKFFSSSLELSSVPSCSLPSSHAFSAPPSRIFRQLMSVFHDPRGQRQGRLPRCLRQLRSLALWQNSHLTQVMSPSSLTTSTTRRLLKSFSGTNPATKTWCPRTCLTRNSTMRPSEKRYLHHCSFRSEKNQ